MDQEATTVSRRKFFVCLAGRTNGAHLDFIAKLKDVGQTEVNSPGESDYVVVFCPIVSRVGTDTSAALEHCPLLAGGKLTILVVLHQTFDPEYPVAGSIRQDRNMVLTVDFLFHEGKLLRCNRNDTAWFEVLKSLGVPPSQVSNFFTNCCNCKCDCNRERLSINFTLMAEAKMRPQLYDLDKSRLKNNWKWISFGSCAALLWVSYVALSRIYDVHKRSL